MQNDNRLKLDTVVRGIHLYGWYPALHMMAKLERKEQFENCAVIKQAFDGLLVGREGELSTKTDPISLDETFDKLIRESRNQEDAAVLIHERPHLWCAVQKE